MMLRKLTAVALVVGIAACGVLAQGKAKGAKAEIQEAKILPSRAMMFDPANVDAYRNAVTPLYIIDAAESDAEPIKLNRSFKESVKVNVDSETLTRLMN